MTTIRTLAAHEIVAKLHPRPPPTEADELGRAVGKAIDATLAQWTHLYRSGPKPTVTAMHRQAVAALDEELRDADLSVPSAELERARKQIEGTLQAFRKSELFGLSRPRTRLVVVDRAWGFYAQPDYWDGRSTFYEMKAYRAVPPPPDVALQLSLFQLAYPGFKAVLVCFQRYVEPVAVFREALPPPDRVHEEELLRTIAPLALELGVPKVLEYNDLPVVHRALPALPPSGTS